MRLCSPGVLLAGLVALASGCAATQAGSSPEPDPAGPVLLSRVPPVLGDGWATTSLARVGLDSLPILEMSRRIASGVYPNIHGVVIARRGKLVFEAYYPGTDQRLDDRPTPGAFGPFTRHDVRSISKSITSLLVGIAIDRGLIPGVSAPIMDFYPEHADLRDEHRSRIGLDHLLTMRSGLAGDEADQEFRPNGAEEPAPDPWRRVLMRGSVAPPGAEFLYAGGNATLLGGAIRRATGMPLDQFAREALFAPLGITDVEWMRWVDGTPRAAGGVRLRPRDLAKLGQLVLNEGRWENRRVVSGKWIARSTDNHVRVFEGREYGYQWWVQSLRAGDRDYRAVTAIGHGGQRLFTIKSLDLVVVFTAGNYDDAVAAALPELLMQRHVLPAVRDRWIAAASRRAATVLGD